MRCGYHGWHDWCVENRNGVTKNITSEILEFKYNDLEKLKDVDLVIEAVAENIEIKHSVYNNVVPHLKESAIMTWCHFELPRDSIYLRY